MRSVRISARFLITLAFLGFSFIGLIGSSCALTSEAGPSHSSQKPDQISGQKSDQNSDQKLAPSAGISTAVFAGGCFWSTEYAFERAPGVIRVVSGFIGGSKQNPSYSEVSLGKTGHIEAVEVTYDAKIVSYAKLLETYWRNINPTQGDGQFFDIGERYRTTIFYANDVEKKLALESKAKLEKSNKFGAPIATQIKPISPFYPAEDEHQDFAKNNPERYSGYKKASGREAYFKKLWGSETTQSPTHNPVPQNPIPKLN